MRKETSSWKIPPSPVNFRNVTSDFRSSAGEREPPCCARLSEVWQRAQRPLDPTVPWRKLLRDKATLLVVFHWREGSPQAPSAAVCREVQAGEPLCRIFRLRRSHAFPLKGRHIRAQCLDPS